MKTYILKYSGIILFIYVILIQSYGQDSPSISIKFGGYLQEVDITSAIASPTWNNVIKGNSSGLLDNKGNLTSCFIRSNVNEAIINPVDFELLRNTVFLDSNDFVTFLNIPFSVYDVYIYVFAYSDTESIAKFTVNSLSKFLLLNNASWDGVLDESTAISESMTQAGKDYIVFRGLSDKEFTIWLESEIKSGLASIQIVKNPASGDGLIPEQANNELTDNVFIYPNPAKNDVYIELSNNYTGYFTIQIIDGLGKVLSSFNKMKYEKVVIEKIDIKQLKAGNYYIVVECSNKKISYPLIKF